MRPANAILLAAISCLPPSPLKTAGDTTPADISVYNQQKDTVDRIVQVAFEETRSDSEHVRKQEKWAPQLTPVEVGGEFYESCPPHQVKSDWDESSYESTACVSCITEGLWSSERSEKLALGLVQVQEALNMEERDIDDGLSQFSWRFGFTVEEAGALSDAGAGYTMGASSSMMATSAGLDTESANSIIFHEFIHSWLAHKSDKSIHAVEEGLAAYVTQMAFPESHFVVPANYDIEYLQIAFLGEDYASAVFDNFDQVIEETADDQNWIGSSAYETGRENFFTTWGIANISMNQVIFDQMYEDNGVMEDLTSSTDEAAHKEIVKIQESIETFGLDWPTVWNYYVESPYKEMPEQFEPGL